MRGSTRKRGKTWTALWDVQDLETREAPAEVEGRFQDPAGSPAAPLDRPDGRRRRHLRRAEQAAVRSVPNARVASRQPPDRPAAFRSALRANNRPVRPQTRYRDRSPTQPHRRPSVRPLRIARG